MRALLDINVPQAGEYLLGFIYKDSLKMNLKIITNNNYFYKREAPVYVYQGFLKLDHFNLFH